MIFISPDKIVNSPEFTDSEKRENLGKFARRELLVDSSLKAVLLIAKDCGLSVEDLVGEVQALEIDNRDRTEAASQEIKQKEVALREKVFATIQERAEQALGLSGPRS